MQTRLIRTVFIVLPLLASAAEAQQLAQATGGAARAGTAAAVRGDVKLAAIPGVREAGKDVASGDPIFLGDQVTTGAEGRLQIMLADETVFTIGPNAAMVIDNFVYDPNTSAGKVTASVLKGTFRFVTGKVAKREPSDMEVKLPVGSIGVRGTSVAGEVDGTRATIVLLGPGPDTNTGERVGRILVTGTGPAGAATTVEIIRPGFGTEISGVNVPPTAAVRIDPGRIAAITAPLAGTAPRPAAPPAAPGQPGGQQTQQQAQPQQPGAAPQQPGPAQPQAPAQAQPAPAQPGQPGPQVAGQGVGSGPSLLAQSGSQAAGGLGHLRTVGALAPAAQQAVKIVASAAQAPPPLGEPTTFEQLRSINSGTATFATQSVPMKVTGGVGTATYSINYSYNFGSRTATGGISLSLAGAGWGTTGTGNFPLLASPFTSGAGPVNINETGITVPTVGGTANVNYKFENSNNIVFKTLKHNMTYTQGGMTAQGQGVTTR